MNPNFAPRTGVQMAYKDEYVGHGLHVSSRFGLEGDHFDILFDIPVDGPAHASVVVVAFGTCANYHESDEAYLRVHDRDHPSTDSDGVRPAGLHRVFVESPDALRYCISLSDSGGNRVPGRSMDGRKFNSEHVLNPASIQQVSIPHGGLFLLTNGIVEIDGKMYSPVSVIVAETKPLVFNAGPGVYGVMICRT
ncbi:hypothetical protein UFOVP1040_65 [uncultured Caudovirales phage]|uniref:Uncharacterized protein n=1 Tax=uncultured Caudovirales phage TaxID=2100421 RepID=A0A6J5QLR3_9CAUD|nr:hypothetical protein UFOVP1040_65 [uncultured Caudovirales phage]